MDFDADTWKKLAIIGIILLCKEVVPVLWILLQGFRVHVLTKYFPANFAEKYGKWAG